MCVILVGKVTKAQYELAKRQNPDGFSLFTEDTGLVKDPGKDVVSKALNHFGVWHFRIGTSGAKDARNIHPFAVCGGQWLLYHNGVLGEGLGKKSDTQALADTLYDSPLETVKSVLQSLSATNRFLLVNVANPRNFLTFGTWVADAGVLLSHRLYSRVVATPVTRYPNLYPSLNQYEED